VGLRGGGLRYLDIDVMHCGRLMIGVDCFNFVFAIYDRVNERPFFV